jgi:3-(3-hydroxy-phenyl)propionate hydroxylase
MTLDRHIIIVGAGPAGLTTAFGLAQQGVRVTVIDQEPDVVDSPRAMVYLPSTVKAMDELGLLTEMKGIAAVGYEYNLRFMATGRVGRMDHRIIADLTPYAYNLHLGQDLLARLILKRFLALPGTAMLWRTTYVSHLDRGSFIELTVKLPDGSTETLRADYLIGADGARSSVRKGAGIDFDGFTWPETFMATNVYYDFGAEGFASSNMLQDPKDWAIIAKINDQGLWRVAYGEDSTLTEEQRRARISERYAALVPRPREKYDVVLANSYRVHQRSATAYRKGRVLLAGDAAHASNPIGGMGFTSGIQDAMLLSHSLVAVLKGDSGDDMLDWYAYERRRVFLEIANPTAIEFKRRTLEGDPKRRQEDEDNFFRMMENPEMMRSGLMSIFALSGRPYQPDWREVLLAADRARSPREATQLLNGAKYTANIDRDVV